MKLYNTRTRKKEEFKSIEPKQVKLYCCGPTVYHYAHIGNLRTYIFEDILRRVLEWNGYEVKHVMNITDVGHLTSDNDEGEDKMKKGAAREKMTVWEIAQKYTDAFFEDMKKLNLLEPTDTPKATDHVQEMIEQIQQLEGNGLTYVGQNGNLYFDTSKLEDYGKLAQLEKQELQAGARIEVDPNKKHSHDFVLWFVQSKHGDQDMQWDSPWGRGFPGWHMECSAMACKYLGNQIDIHCGGIDHIPVHHTNEIAQAEGATGIKPWVKFWMHGEFLVLKDRAKMAKSEGNFLTLSSVIEKGFDPLDYRYFCLQTHYRKELSFSWEGLEGAQNARKRMRDKVNKLKDSSSRRSPGTSPAMDEEKGNIITSCLNKFTQTIKDDLNMPQALAVTWELLDDKELGNADKLSTILEFDKVLGLKLDEKEVVELPAEIKQWIAERDEARKNKDWEKADEIRDQIQASGKWLVKDGAGGTEVMEK